MNRNKKNWGKEGTSGWLNLSVVLVITLGFGACKHELPEPLAHLKINCYL